MTIYFLDTSALAKRYLNEKGSRWLRAQVKPSAHNIIVVSKLCLVEIFSLLHRQYLAKGINAPMELRARRLFSLHLKGQYASLKIDDTTLKLASRLVRRHSLKSLDAIQLASALESRLVFRQGVIFLSADNRLLSAAAAETLVTDNPELHP